MTTTVAAVHAPLDDAAMSCFYLILLERVALSIKEDLAPGRNPTSLVQSRLYLRLSDFLCCEWYTSDSVQPLRDIEYWVVECSMTSQKFRGARTWV